MNHTRPVLTRSVSAFTLAAAFVLCCASVTFAKDKVQQGEVQKAEHAKTPPLRDVIPLKEDDEHGRHEKPLRLIVRTPKSVQADPVVQSSATASAAASVGNVVSFDGLGVGGGYTPNAAPPDTNGAVGATQYVQWVNESFAVYDKATGARIYGPAAGNTLFQALGATHPCAVNNDGDPIAQYDKAANRWVLTQFSVTSGNSKGYWQCVAVSTTSDATGSYNVYAYNYGTVQFNDYPKVGVWSNAYLVTYNIFNNGNTFAGSKVCAWDRAAMINGTAANQVCFQTSSLYGGLLPSDIDGLSAPPAGSPAYFVAFDTNILQLWKLANVNFGTGTASFTGPTNIPVAAFSAACSGGGTCIPQSGTTQKLDSLADRLMYRLAYRNFGDHEALVVNHAVTAGTSVGLRWYELRDLSAATPTVYQQGTFAPDATYRWMGSAAMDSAGNLAIGYSASSSSLKPSVRFTGRAPSDPLGTLGTPEIVIKDGTGAQTIGLSRWGDYSALSVDPVDDCTMWYTTEYLQTNGTFNWSTRIGYFKFAGCGAQVNPDFAIGATPASQSVAQGSSGNYNVTVTPSGSFNGTVDFSVSGLPSGVSATFNPNSVAGSGSSTMAVAVGAATAAGSYPLTITGTSGSIVHSTAVTLVVTAPPPPDFSLTAAPGSNSVVQGGSTSYTATVTPANGYSGTVAFSVSGLPAGATGTFNPTSVVSSGSSTLSVATSAGTPAGTYTLTITGSDGTLSHSSNVTLVVSAQNPPDFTIAATPASNTLPRGGSTTYSVAVGAVNGFSGTVNLSVTGLPSRFTATFNPAVVNGSGNSTLTVSSQNNGRGSFTLTITGTSGGTSHSTNVTLIVQ